MYLSHGQMLEIILIISDINILYIFFRKSKVSEKVGKLVVAHVKMNVNQTPVNVSSMI